MPNATFFKLINEFLQKNKGLAVAYIAMLAFFPVQDIGVPHVVGKIIKTMRVSSFDFKYLYILMGIVLCGQFMTTFNDYIDSKLFPKFQTFISEKVITYILDTCSTNMQDILTGRILSMLNNTPKTIYNFMETWRATLIPQLVVALVAIAYFAFYSWILALIMIIILVLYYLMLFITIRGCGATAMEREKYLLSVNDEIDDVFTNIIAIFSNNKTKEEHQRIKTYFNSYEEFSEKALKCTMKYKYTIVPIIVMLSMTFIYVGFMLVEKKTIPLEGYIAMILIFIQVFTDILRSIGIIKDTALRWGMIKENLEIFSSLEPGKCLPKQDVIEKKEYITFQDVSFAYGNTVIFSQLNLRINKNDKVLIIGKIGKGKTTILKLLMRYQQQNAGTIYLEGVPIQNIEVHDIRKRIGFIPQTPVLFNRTLYENITYGSENVSRESVLKLIKDLGLDHIFDVSRLDDKVGKHGSKLSGGQRQVVWILRILIQDPEIILMDEPTASIDAQTKEFIYDLFKIVMQGRTTIIVSHDLNMSSLCDKVIKIS